MKRTYTKIPLCIIFLYFVFGSVTAQDLKSGLISVWEFNETSGTTAFDSHSSNDGSISNVTVNQTGLPNLTPSYSFSGYYSNLVSVNNSSGVFSPGGQLTVSAWVKPDVYSSSDAPICLDITSTSSYAWLLYTSGSTSADYLSFYVRTASGVTTAGYSVANGALFNGSWIHVVMVYDRTLSANRLKLYINNTLSATSNGYDEDIKTTTNPLAFGRWGSSSGYYKGTMDQPSIWNRPLTEAEIAQLYNSGAGLPYSQWGIRDLVGGEISPDFLIINSGESPGVISNVTAASGGDGTYTYQWQVSTDGNTFSDISGANGISYTAPTLTQNTWYRRKVTNGATTEAYSNKSVITVATSLWLANGSNIFNSNNGNVGIGTSIPDEKLTVAGKIHAKEFIVDLSVPAPDYVFKDNYHLCSLEELENFLEQNNHLPEFPPAMEMETNGIKVSEINLNLLKRVEELTLYVLEQEKCIEKLENQLKMKNDKK